jgi:hypothetical protein
MSDLKYKIVAKEDSTLMKIIGKLLFFNKGFMTNYVTTLGSTIYAPGGEISDITLQHELVHVKDWKRWNILFSLSYLLFLPAGLTLRSVWEKRGYEVTIRETVRTRRRYAMTQSFKDRIVRQFTGANYLYMWPFKKGISKWFDKTLAKYVGE